MVRKCYVTADYFRIGDYTHWFDAEVPDGKMSYNEYIEKVLIPQMEQYESLILYEDGCLYGVKNGIVHDISYNEFDPNTEEGKQFFQEMLENISISKIRREFK